jgi:hypothetical protein
VVQFYSWVSPIVKMLKIITTSLLVGAFGLVGFAAIPSAEAANSNTATNVSSDSNLDGQLAKKHKKGGKKKGGGKKAPKGPPPRR